MQLPSSNRVGIVLISVVFVVALTIFIANRPEKVEPDLEQVDLLVKRNTDSTYNTADSDGDGLFDWQETLWGTNPHNSDTDGDGTFDGDEIAMERDPRIAGPDDILKKNSPYFNVDTELDFSNFATGTISDKVSLELFSQYVQLKHGEALTPEKEAELVNNLSQKVVEESNIEDYFSQADLSIVESNQNSVKTYGDSFAQISLTYLKELDSLKSMPENVYLNQISQKYQEFAIALSTIGVPAVASEIHLILINNIHMTGTVFDILNQQDTDPMKALIAMSEYQKNQTEEGQLYTTLARYFKNNGIIFDNAETIRFWNYFE